MTTRARFALALLALLTRAGGVHAAAPAPVADAVGELARSMRAADTIQVSRFWLDWRDSTLAGERRLISLRHRLAFAPVRAAWMKRLVAQLLPPLARESQSPCPVLDPGHPGPGPWLASVNWTSPSGRGQAILDLADRCAYFAQPGVSPLSVEVRDDSTAGALLALLREALSADTALRAIGAVRAAAAAPGDTLLPAFGELVRAETVPACTLQVAPQYPAAARVAGVQGTVVIQALVDRGGIVRDARVGTSVPGLDEVALAAVRQWRFKPATFRQRPLAVWVAVPVTFHLH